jgi:hypothetical protein
MHKIELEYKPHPTYLEKTRALSRIFGEVHFIGAKCAAIGGQLLTERSRLRICGQNKGESNRKSRLNEAPMKMFVVSVDALHILMRQNISCKYGVRNMTPKFNDSEFRATFETRP